MPLTVLSVAFPFARVAPDAAGGGEQVLAMLDAALQRVGHRSIVIGTEGSCVCGRLVAVPAPRETIRHDAWGRAHDACRSAIAATLAAERVDVVHLHGLDFPAYLPDAPVPTIATLHLPIAWYAPWLPRIARPAFALRCVSTSQRRTLKDATAPVDVIHNGVPIEHLPRLDVRRRSHAVVLSRICVEKGVHLAMDAAARAGVPLFVAGQTYPFEEHIRYFAGMIRPRLNARCRFVGRIGPRGKARLLSSASCLLVPSRAPETSSLAAMEALACGTPVVAFDTGALPEIVDHGVTGFIVRTVEEMAEAMRDVSGLDRNACRTQAIARFSASRMVREYIDLYHELARTPCA